MIRLLFDRLAILARFLVILDDLLDLILEFVVELLLSYVFAIDECGRA
jgi:hypothetical protein